VITQRIIVRPEDVDETVILPAAEIIKNGGLVAFPTETVYGLGADAFNSGAVKRIYEAKGRPSDNPMIVHIADKEDIMRIAREVSEETKILMENFSPGPITYILKKNPQLNDTVTAGLDTVAVRIPSHKTANALIRLSGCAIAAPSANLSGKPSPTRAGHVVEDMDGRIECIIEGGACEIGVESTVIDMTGKVPVILRPGGITIEMIRRFIPSAVMNTELKGDVPKSPGMKYKHYAPNAEVVVVEGRRKDGVIDKIRGLCNENTDKRTGVILRKKELAKINADFIFYAGETSGEYASNLFMLLRKCDENKVDIVYAELEPDGGIGEALRNRIYKSAGNNVIRIKEEF